MAADLRSRIERGELQPGEQVPSLDRLARDYDVSRATAQKALQLSDQQHNTPLSQTLQSHLKLYQSGQPLRE